MAPRKTFPDVLYVVKEKDGDASYFVNYEMLDEIDKEDGRVVAVYRREKVGKLKVDVKFTTNRTK